MCAPVIERLRFLFNELRPAVCSDLSVLSRLKLLSSLPRWRRVAQKIIRDGRKKRGEDRRAGSEGAAWGAVLGGLTLWQLCALHDL